MLLQGLAYIGLIAEGMIEEMSLQAFPKTIMHVRACLRSALILYGYERGQTIRASPYDFRFAPRSQPFFFSQLQQLVEHTWAGNGGRKVVLVAHSMGGLYATYFLSRQPAAWKNRYVETLVTISTPWAGENLLGLLLLLLLLLKLGLFIARPTCTAYRNGQALQSIKTE